MIKENQHTEFKPKFNEDVIETLVAFANSKGGKVYVGVENNGSPVKNFVVGKETIQQWINEVKTKTQPQLIPDGEIIEYKGSGVVELFIQEYPIKPVATRGKYYKRVGNSNHLLSAGEIANIHLQTKNTSWDYYPRPGKSLQDISLEKVDRVQSLIEQRNPNLLFENREEFLLKNELLLENNSITNGCYLLFSNDRNSYTTIQMGRFQSEIIIKDDVTSQSDIVSQVDEVMAFIRKHINKEIIITDTQIENIQRWQYPLDAIREIVLNMIVHRDYQDSGHSIIKIFNEKIEFYNPGELMYPLTMDDLLSNEYVSKPRNRQIAELIKGIGWIEKYGTGIRRIREMFQEYGSKVPDFNIVSGCFAVTAYAIDYQDDEEFLKNVIENDIENDIENREKQILGLLQMNNKLSVKKISDQLNVSWSTVMRDLSKLKSKGLIERIGADKGGYWKIIK